MTKENGLVNYERSDQESIAEDFHELRDWHAWVITKRLAEADLGEEGLDHGEVFSRLKRRLEVKI